MKVLVQHSFQYSFSHEMGSNVTIFFTSHDLMYDQHAECFISLFQVLVFVPFLHSF